MGRRRRGRGWGVWGPSDRKRLSRGVCIVRSRRSGAVAIGTSSIGLSDNPIIAVSGRRSLGLPGSFAGCAELRRRGWLLGSGKIPRVRSSLGSRPNGIRLFTAEEVTPHLSGTTGIRVLEPKRSPCQGVWMVAPRAIPCKLCGTKEDGGNEEVPRGVGRPRGFSRGHRKREDNAWQAGSFKTKVVCSQGGRSWTWKVRELRTHSQATEYPEKEAGGRGFGAQGGRDFHAGEFGKRKRCEGWKEEQTNQGPEHQCSPVCSRGEETVRSKEEATKPQSGARIFEPNKEEKEEEEKEKLKWFVIGLVGERDQLGWAEASPSEKGREETRVSAEVADGPCTPLLIGPQPGGSEFGWSGVCSQLSCQDPILFPDIGPTSADQSPKRRKRALCLVSCPGPVETRSSDPSCRSSCGAIPGGGDCCSGGQLGNSKMVRGGEAGGPWSYPSSGSPCRSQTPEDHRPSVRPGNLQPWNLGRRLIRWWPLSGLCWRARKRPWKKRKRRKRKRKEGKEESRRKKLLGGSSPGKGSGEDKRVRKVRGPPAPTGLPGWADQLIDNAFRSANMADPSLHDTGRAGAMDHLQFGLPTGASVVRVPVQEGSDPLASALNPFTISEAEWGGALLASPNPAQFGSRLV